MTKDLESVFFDLYKDYKKKANKHWNNPDVRDFYLQKAEIALKNSESFNERSLLWMQKC